MHFANLRPGTWANLYFFILLETTSSRLALQLRLSVRRFRARHFSGATLREAIMALKCRHALPSLCRQQPMAGGVFLIRTRGSHIGSLGIHIRRSSKLCQRSKVAQLMPVLICTSTLRCKAVPRGRLNPTKRVTATESDW